MTKMQKIRKLFVWLVIIGFAGSIAFGENELIIAQGIDLSSFDSHTHTTTAYEAVTVNVMDYLVMMDANGDRQPALATSWEPISDTTWRFHLREGVKWHDGELFTAADVKFTLERVSSDSSLTQYENYRQIREVEIVNDHEVLIHTYGPEPILINRLSRIGSGIAPMHYVQEVGWDAFGVAPIGTGPYRMVEWHRDDRIVLEAFEDHWRGVPTYDRIIHRTIIEDSTRVNELLTGGVHIATNVPSQEENRVSSSGIASTLPWPSPRIMLFVINTADDKPTSDPLVREALDYAIDNQVLVDALMGGYGAPVRARATPGVTGVPMEYYDTYLYDPERAVELLQEAGYGPGDLTIKLEGPLGRYPMDSEIVELVAVMFESVGINVEMEVLEWSSFNSRVWNANNIETMALIGLSNSMFDGWHALRAFMCEGSYKDRTHWCNEEFDNFVLSAEVELDETKRVEFLRGAFEILIEERPLITLHQVEGLVGVSNTVAWTPRPDEYLWMFDAEPVGQ